MEPIKLDQLRKKWLLILSVLFLIIGIILFFYWILISRFYEFTDDAYVSGNLVQVMPQISANVTEILADETDLVVKNQPLLVLDKADATITLQKAQAKLALTVRQVNQQYQNVYQLQADVKAAQTNFEKVKEDYQRRKELLVSKYISVEDLQHAKLALDSATATLSSAEHKLSAAIDIVGDIDLYHHPQVLSDIVNLRNAYLNWFRTTIYAPDTGYIAKRSVQVGQYVTPKTVLMIIVPLNQIWVDANYKETQLKNIRIGQPVEVTSDTFGSDVTYDGTVVGINPGAGDTFDLLPPQNATGNWIKIVQRLPVRIALDPKQLEKYPLRLGLSVSVTVNTHNRKGAMLATLPKSKIIYQTNDEINSLKAADQMIDKILQENAPNTRYQTSHQEEIK